jgi:hypothetical protein
MWLPWVRRREESGDSQKQFYVGFEGPPGRGSRTVWRAYWRRVEAQGLTRSNPN